MFFYNFVRALVYAYFKIFYKVNIVGTENIPTDDAFIVCANHTSNLDPPLLGACLPFKLSFMAKEELFKNKIFAKIITSLGAFPVRRGKGDLGALRSAVKILKSGSKLAIFPEGGRGNGEHLRKGKAGAALIAIKAEAPILPIGINGKYKLFGKITVHIGKKIVLEEYYGKRFDSEELKKITDDKIMPTISELSGVKTYENRDS